MNPLKKLERTNIGSVDLDSNDVVYDYLDGQISKSAAVKVLKRRLKEVSEVTKSINKLLVIFEDCPSKVTPEER